MANMQNHSFTKRCRVVFSLLIAAAMLTSCGQVTDITNLFADVDISPTTQHFFIGSTQNTEFTFEFPNQLLTQANATGSQATFEAIGNGASLSWVTYDSTNFSITGTPPEVGEFEFKLTIDSVTDEIYEVVITVAEAAPVSFGNDLTDVDKISYITPPGAVDDGEITPYVQVHYKSGNTRIPVYAPVDSDLVVPVYYRDGDRELIILTFKVTENLYYYYDHLTEVGEDIQAVLSSTPSESSTGSSISPFLSFSAGDIVGYVNGDTDALEFGVMDFTTRNVYADPARFRSDKRLHGGCVFDYFTTTLSDQYHALIGYQGTDGVVLLDECRNPSRDVAGSLAGAWFKADAMDNNALYGSSLAIVTQLDDQVIVSGVGDTTQTIRVLSTDDSWADPESVTTTACYHNTDSSLPDQYVHLTIVDSSQLDVIVGGGECPADVSALTAIRYKR